MVGLYAVQRIVGRKLQKVIMQHMADQMKTPPRSVQELASRLHGVGPVKDKKVAAMTLSARLSSRAQVAKDYQGHAKLFPEKGGLAEAAHQFAFDSSPLNKSLRETGKIDFENLKQMDRLFGTKYSKHDWGAFTAATQAKLSKKVVTYRGVSDRIGDKVLKSKGYTAKGFVSQTMDSSMAAHFTDRGGSKTILEIITSKGAVIGNVGRKQRLLQSEIVSAHGSKYKVLGVDVVGVKAANLLGKIDDKRQPYRVITLKQVS